MLLHEFLSCFTKSLLELIKVHRKNDQKPVKTTLKEKRKIEKIKNKIKLKATTSGIQKAKSIRHK